MTIALRPYQSELDGHVSAAWAAGHRNVVMRLDTGGGKCLAAGTPVLRYDGKIVPVEDIRTGDLLIGPDSKPKRVLSTCTGWEEMYRVTPVKGSPYTVNASHILSLREVFPTPGKIVNLSVREYLKKSDRWKHVHKGWRSSQVDFAPSTPLPMDPYVLGVWLGDGHSGECCITTMDNETARAWAELAQLHGLNITVRPAGGQSITVAAGLVKGKKNPITEILRGLNVWKNKHVPLIYRTAPASDRLQLLAGLMDTDGSYTGKGFDFISKRFDLADGVCFLARSLGMAAYLKPCKKSSQNGTGGDYYRVSISGNIDRIPCRLLHKQAAPRRQIKSVLNTGIRVEPVGHGRYFGFELEGDGLFLLGDFTVTHNTRILAAIVERHLGASCVIAHRSEIVAQLSMALADCGVRHNIIASAKDRQAIAALHVQAFGRSFFDPNARCAVASVQTLVRRKNLDAWAAQVTLWVCDEAHHLVLDNQWHTAIAKFTNPHVLGLMPTATPQRADGQGLGRPEIGGNGVAYTMVEGPPMRWLIDEGYLCDYRIIGANSHIEELLGEIGPSGDWTPAQRKAAEQQSPIVGNAAETYRAVNAGEVRGVPPSPQGRTGILFASDVEMATEFLQRFRSLGVLCELVTGETDAGVRRKTFADLEAGRISLVMAVDIVSEGTDIPALALGIFCRATASLAVYMQQFGRILRPLMTPQYKAARTREERLAAIAASPKPLAYIIDHVGNFTRHGPPDRPREWSLASTSRRGGKSDALATRYCCEPTCAQAFERFRPCCPYCGWEPPAPSGRSSPGMVSGDMSLLDPEVLAVLRGQAGAVQAAADQAQTKLRELQEEAATPLLSLDDYRAKLAASGLPQQYIWRNAKTYTEKLKTHDADMAEKIAKQTATVEAHAGKLAAQAALREVMSIWGGYARAAGLTDREIQRLFYERFGVDVLTPLSYGPAEAGALAEKILFDGAVKSL